MPQAIYDRQLTDFNAILELDEFWDTPARHLSLGQRVRCEIAGAMLHDPSIVFLDEPTIGMDVVVKEQTRQFLRSQVEERGRTIVLTTHDMTEVARLCERVLLINHGRLMFDGTLDELKAAHGGKPIVNVTFSEPVGALEVSGTNVVSHDGIHAVLAPIGSSTPEDVVRALISRFPVVNIGVVETNLEDVMRDVYYRLSTRARAISRTAISWPLRHPRSTSGVTAVQVSATVTHPHRSWRILRIGLLNERAYRVRLVVAPVTLAVQLYLYDRLWTAVFSHTKVAAGLTLRQTLSYSLMALLIARIRWNPARSTCVTVLASRFAKAPSCIGSCDRSRRRGSTCGGSRAT